MAISGSSAAVGWTSHPIYHVDREERRRWRRRDKRRKQKKNKTKQRRCGKIQKREGTKLNENYRIRIVCTGVMEV